MRDIYLVRHGEPILDKFAPYCIGKVDIHLSNNGINQAKLLKNYFSSKKIEKMYSSSLRRCVQTAGIISPQEPLVVKGLQEINMGDWDGLSFKEIKHRYPTEYEIRGYNLKNYIVPNGESFEQCQKRSVESFLNVIKSCKGNIVIVSHAGVNRTLICWLKNISLNSVFNIPQPYGCVNIIKEYKGQCIVNEIGVIPQKEVKL